MIVAIQQPEHLPWIGFFNKMLQVDLYVNLDNVQFKKRYFENRNKIKFKDGVRWLSVPVITKGRYTQRINEVQIENNQCWKKKYLGSLEHGYKKTPYWQDVRDIVFPSIESDIDRLVDLNISLIEKCKDYLDIRTSSVLASSLNVDHLLGSDMILDICVKTGASVYIGGPDGRTYLKLDEFEREGIKVVYHDFVHPEYPQKHGAFETHTSIIDLIANMGPDSKRIVKECYKMGLRGMVHDRNNQ
jgi:hypothetical protein